MFFPSYSSFPHRVKYKNDVADIMVDMPIGGTALSKLKFV
jgi:hypothetical protein